MSCCTTILDLGCFTACELIDTNIPADAVNYRVEWDFLGVSNRVTVAGVTGFNLMVPAFIFNESSIPVFQVYNTSTEVYISVSGADCYQSKITPTNNPLISYDLADALTFTFQTDEFTGVTANSVTATKTVSQLLGVYRNGVLQNTSAYTLAGLVVTFTVPLVNEDVQIIYLTP